MAYLYILQSVHLGKFYIGSTNGAPGDRLKKHLANHNGFTAKVKDWIVVYTEFFDE
ncbi:MAG: GIY-YIG nuclease family protein [Chitinophagaceae bacterium]|nr:GIY-YIG nuclease family protein [Chitinophagaceae bacterium]